MSDKSIWQTLSAIDCSAHIEKKGQFSYLAWTWAWAMVKENYPLAEYHLEDDLIYSDATMEVRVTVSIEGLTHTIWLPVLDFKNKPIANPNAFDIERDNRGQLAFGYGGHMCLGQHLAVLEVAIFFKELMSRLDWIELAGEPKWVEAVFVGGLKSLPVRYAFK